MDVNKQKELLSLAYVKAVAATVGLGLYTPYPDDDSVDIGLAASGIKGTIRSPRLELQAKATARDLLYDDGLIHFPLTIKNYDDLRPVNLMVPRILVVMLVPEDINQWLEISDEQLLIRHCAYWCSLRELPETSNPNNITVYVPILQRFDVAGLSAIMERISNDQLP
jgi:hypothetical protein